MLPEKKTQEEINNLAVFENQSIVIIGAMNPVIHHPAWYLATSIITQSEFDKTLSKAINISAELAQFTLDDISIICLQNRWQISCDKCDGKRILTIAKATFDKLYHTPVSAYGINHNFDVETTREIPHTLMAILTKTRLPFPKNEVGTAAFSYIAESSDCTFKTNISASSRGHNFLYIQNNAHFIVGQEETKHFDLGPLLDKAFQKNEDRSQMILSSFSNFLKQFGD